MSGYVPTTAWYRIKRMNARINICQGGARAGKTVGILTVLCDLSSIVDDQIIHIVSDTYPNLRHGAMEDWTKMLRKNHKEHYFTVNKSEHKWTNVYTGTRIEFMSCDDSDALGAPRDYLFVNEGWRISYDTFSQLEMRTEKKIWIDFNPINEFWVHTEIMAKRDDWQFEKFTYKDNEGIPPSIKAALLQRRGDGTNNWWRVYGLGEIGSLEGNVYEGWQVVDERPDGFVLRDVGVDFGWNDPTAVVAVYENRDGDLFIQNKLYESKLPTNQLIAKLKNDPEICDELFVCDNARPEIIDEMNANGLRAIGCNKTAGEKMNGKRYNIDLVQRRKVYYLADDKDLEREYLTYAWRKKKSTGEVLNEPEDGNDHLMDALAYAVRELAKPTPDMDDFDSTGDYDDPDADRDEDDGWDDEYDDL